MDVARTLKKQLSEVKWIDRLGAVLFTNGKITLQEYKKIICQQRDALLLEASNVARCVSKGKSEPFECRNHIRVLQSLGDGERLYVCGTNAHSPKDWVVYVSLSLIIIAPKII